MTEKTVESEITNRYGEFLRGLRKTDRELFQKLLLEIESHYYMFSTRKTSVTEDLLLGFLLNQKRINDLQGKIDIINHN